VKLSYAAEHAGCLDGIPAAPDPDHGKPADACVTGLHDGGDPDNSRPDQPVHTLMYASF
jgi:hypothetical protein